MTCLWPVDVFTGMPILVKAFSIDNIHIIILQDSSCGHHRFD